MMPPEGHLMDRYGDIAEAGCPSFTNSQSKDNDLRTGSFTIRPVVYGAQSLYVGGNWNNTDNAGVSNVNANNLNNSNNNIGSRQSEVKEVITVDRTPPLGEKRATIQILPVANDLDVDARGGLFFLRAQEDSQ